MSAATEPTAAGTSPNTDSRRWSELLDTLGQGAPAHDAPAADACAEAIGQMFLFLDRELDDPAARHRIATHLEICVDCVATYDTEKLVRAVLLRSCSGERAPAELRSRIAELIAASDRSIPRD